MELTALSVFEYWRILILTENKIIGSVMFQYQGQSRHYADILDYLNIVFTGVFAVEFVLKIIAFKVKVCSRCIVL